MADFTPKKVPKRSDNTYDIVALFCYKYPQYTFAQAKKLPFSRILHMLRVARREDASRMYELTQIVAGPHSNKGKAVKKMLEYYKKIINE